LTGKVQTEAGETLSEFTVKIWKINQTWEQRSQTFTNSDDIFRMPSPWARIMVEVKAPGYSQGKAVEVNISAESGEHVFVVKQAAFLSGTVTDKGGNPVANVKVSIGGNNSRNRRRWNQNNGATTTTTDSLGRYKLDTLQVKEHSVTASIGEVSETQKVDLQIGKNQHDFTIDVGSIIHIRTTDPQNKPVEVSQIWFQNKDGGWPRPERMPLKELGLAEFVGLKVGEYTVHLTVSGYAAVKKNITVAEGDTEFSIQVVKGAVIRGMVTGSDGNALKNITVRLRKEDEARNGGWGTGKNARTDADGAYSLGPVEPGEWLLEVYSNSGWNVVYESTLNVTSGEMQQDISVETGATIKVSIVDESGKKLSWGRVRVRGEKPYSGNADASGVATVAFITPGDYTVSATASGLASLTTKMYLNNGTAEITLTVKKPNSARVTRVFDGQASKIGIKVGDLIVEYGSVNIKNWSHVNVAKRSVKDGELTQIVVDRDGQLLTFPIKGGTIGIDGEDALR
ncbi:MAG: carboxypeptidase regulatory-like domain-containing protein, partial [Planctomycetota bacterium]